MAPDFDTQGSRVELTDLTSSAPSGHQENVEVVVLSSNWQPDHAQPTGGNVSDALRMWMQALGVRQKIGLSLTPIVIIATFVTEASTKLKTPEQHRLLGVLCLATVLWLSEALPVPVTGMLLGPFICAFGACPGGKKCELVALPPYMQDVIFLLLGSGLLATAMTYHGSDRRFAEWLTSLPAVQGKPAMLRILLAFAALLMAFVVSGPAMIAMFLPILMQLSGAEYGQPLVNTAAQTSLSGDMLSALYAILAGCMATKLSPSVLICTGNLEDPSDDNLKVRIGFFQYMLVGIPASVLITTLGLCVTSCMLPAQAAVQMSQSRQSRASRDMTRSKPWSFGEKVSTACWLLAIVLWVVPSFTSIHLANGVAAMLATVPLFLFPDMGEGCKKPVLPFDVAMKRTGWGSLLLGGGAISLGKMMMQTKLAKVIASSCFTFLPDNIFLLTTGAALFTIFLTEILSNLAAITLVTPIMFELGLTMTGGDKNAALMAALVVPMGSSCSFMMPWASVMNSAVYESKHVTFGQMVKYGLIMNISCAVVISVFMCGAMPIVFPHGKHFASGFNSTQLTS